MHVNNILFLPSDNQLFFDLWHSKTSAFINKKTDLTYSRIIGMIVKSKVH